MTELRGHWEGEPVRVWEEVWGIPRLEAWGRLASTNDRARELVREGAPSWTVVVAEAQTAGRGRAGRSWISPPEVGLFVSFLVRPRGAGQATLTPLLVGMALARAVEEVAGVEVQVKWPNDALIEGRKVAGILCERVGDRLVVGVGVNVRRWPGGVPPELSGSATTLEDAAGESVSRSALAGALLREARRLLDAPVLRLEGALADELAARDVLRGRRLAVGSMRGEGAGIAPDGRLRVRTVDGTIKPVLAGHVEMERVGA